MSAPAPADQSVSVAVSRRPDSRRRAWNGQPIVQIRVQAARVASGGSSRGRPSGSAMSWPWTSTSGTRLR
jgi:hypothetical protein